MLLGFRLDNENTDGFIAEIGTLPFLPIVT